MAYSLILLKVLAPCFRNSRHVGPQQFPAISEGTVCMCNPVRIELLWGRVRKGEGGKGGGGGRLVASQEELAEEGRAVWRGS